MPKRYGDDLQIFKNVNYDDDSFENYGAVMVPDYFDQNHEGEI